jgi:hypothetical protein
MTEFRQSKRQALVSSRDSRTAVAAILAGVLIFAGKAGELAFGNTLTPLWVALGGLWIAAYPSPESRCSVSSPRSARTCRA